MKIHCAAFRLMVTVILFMMFKRDIIECENNATQGVTKILAMTDENPIYQLKPENRLKAERLPPPGESLFVFPSRGTLSPRYPSEPSEGDFPLAELFNLTIPIRQLPKYLCTQQPFSFPNKVCDCTKECMKYRKCCIDIEWNTSKPLQIEYYLRLLINDSKKYKQISCRKTFDTLKNESQTYYMVTTCLKGSKVTDTQKCLLESDDLYENIPVLGEDGYLYKNEYCARCNFLNQYKHVTIAARCVGNVSLITGQKINNKDLYNLPRCFLSIGNKSKDIRECKPQPFCTTENRTLYDLCHSYETPLAITKYKNYHCFLCDKQRNKTFDENILTSQNIKDCSTYPCHYPNGKDTSKYSSTFDLVVDSIENNNVVISNLRKKFPIRHFLNVHLNYTFPFDEGLEHYICKSIDSFRSCCHCKPGCALERKCCIDAFWNEINPLPLELYLQEFIAKMNTIKEHTCLPIYPYAEDLNYQSEYRFMVKSCENVESLRDVSGCLQSSNDSTAVDIMPVFDSVGNLYANAFCARCNMVYEFEYANITMECKKFMEYERVLQNENRTYNNRNVSLCYFDLSRHNSFPSFPCDSYAFQETPKRECVKSNNTDKNYQLCYSYYGTFGSYANYHCWKCNNNDLSSGIDPSFIKYCVPSCGRECKTVIRPVRLFSFTISFSSGVFNIESKNLQEPLTCKSDETFDFKEFKCVKILCPPNYYLIDSICEQRQEHVPNKFNIFDNRRLNSKDITMKHCLLAQDTKLYLVDSFFNNTMLFNNLSNVLPLNPTIDSIYSNNHFEIYKVNSTITIEALRRLEKYFTDSTFVQNKNISIVILRDIDNLLLSERYRLDPSRFYRNNQICSKPKILKTKDITFSGECNIIFENNIYKTNVTSFWVSFHNNTLNEHISICEQFHLSKSCARKFIKDGTIIDPQNNTLTHTHSKGTDTYQPEEYIPLNDGYYVCVTSKLYNVPSATSSRFQDLYNIVYYISIVTTSISCVCYIWIIINYLMFPELLTIPGFNNIFMCASLFIADILFLISLQVYDDRKACIGIAIVRHWSSLCAFMWTVVIALDLVSRFGSFNLATTDRYTQRVLVRCSFAFLVPTVIVSIVTVLDLTSQVNIGYGLDGVCWINNLYARVGFYIIPVGCFSLFTFLALVYTLRNIYNDKTRTEKILNKSSNTSRSSFLKIALKLVIILGVTEFIGFVQIPGSSVSADKETFNATFKFIYSILRSLRGTLLWFVYILGGQVLKKYKKLIMCSIRKSAVQNGRELSDFNKARSSKNPRINSNTTGTDLPTTVTIC